MKTNRALMLGALSIAATLILTSCGPSSKSVNVIEITCDQEIMLLNYANSENSAPGLQSNLVLYLCGPSLLFVNAQEEGKDNQFLYLYLPEDGNRLDFRIEGDLFYVNGIVRAVNIEANNPRNFAKWHESADETALKLIRVILSENTLDPETTKAIQAVRNVNPNTTICIGNGEWTPPEKPLFFMGCCESDESGAQEIITRIDFTETRVLILEDNDAETLDILSHKAMPNLYRLILSGDHGENTLLEDFPHVKAVTLAVEKESPNLSPLHNLEELHVMEEVAIDFNQLPNPEALRMLTLMTENISGLEKLTNLEYLNPGERTFSEEELKAMLSSHPNLVYLNLVHAEIENLEPLRNAKQLEGLIIGQISDDAMPDFTPLKDLRHLRYIGIPDNPSSEMVDALRATCPQAMIYLQGMCLGSGWLVLFLPLLLILLLLKRNQMKTRDGAS